MLWKGDDDIPVPQAAASGDTWRFDLTRQPRVVTKPASVARRTRFFLRLRTSMRRRLDGFDCARWDFVAVASCSRMAGESSGEVVPDRGSFRPLSPLCSFVRGAGSPLRKCSSSASVPLSLPGVDSFEKAGGYAVRLACREDFASSPRPLRWTAPLRS